jgi:hypothetical protein
MPINYLTSHIQVEQTLKDNPYMISQGAPARIT